MDIIKLTPLRKYLILSVAVSIFVLMSILMWLRYENLSLREELVLINQAVKTQTDRVTSLKDSIVETSKRTEDLKKAVDKVNKDQTSALAEIKKLKESSSEIKEYLNTRVPADLSKLLQDYRSGKIYSRNSTEGTGAVLPRSSPN